LTDPLESVCYYSDTDPLPVLYLLPSVSPYCLSVIVQSSHTLPATHYVHMTCCFLLIIVPVYVLTCL